MHYTKNFFHMFYIDVWQCYKNVEISDQELAH